ncbi:MAG: ComEC/Rec2 family competence protein [bacterium]|nr:ComEC/Rec2 family competence protein [bacterium]
MNSKVLVLAVCILVVAGAAAYSVWRSHPETPTIDPFLGAYSGVEGVVVKDPDVRDSSVLLTVEIEKINGTPAEGRMLAIANRFADVSYGDRVLASGQVVLPEAFETDTGRVFDYPKYLLAQGITHQLRFATVQVVAHGEGNLLVAGLLSVKHTLLHGIQNALPEPESSLAAGLLLGDKRSLGDAITEAFRRAGVVHIIVLSGYNVSLVIGAVLFLALYFLRKRLALALAALAILGFVVMTGASETGIRAGAMALIALFAKVLNRPADGVRILFVVAAGMALLNPYLVLYDLSYQLSILATLGLVLFSDPLAKKIPFVSGAFGFREIVSTTVSTQLTVLPLLILSIGQVSVVSLFTNILVLPAVPFAMLASFIASLVALLSQALAFPFSAIAYALLHYIISVSVWFGNLPFAAVPVSTDATWLTLSILACVYAGVFLFFAIRTKRKATSH